MLILKDVSQINKRLNDIFDLEKPFEDNDLSFVNRYLSEEEILSIIKNVGEISGKENQIEELSLLIFQLKDYIPALCNLTNMFLLSKNYDSVYFFTTKLFISHIGTINYQSAGSYKYIERFFDRFIEIVKNCNISIEHYIPFILEIFRSKKEKGLAQWKAPALEYMKTFFNENEEWVIKFLENSPRKFEMMELLCKFNTQKGLKYALEYFSENNEDVQDFLELFKNFKKETLLYIDQKLIYSSNEVLTKFAQILFSWGDDSDAKSRLEEIYKLSDDRALRNEISQKIGVRDGISFKNEKQFLLAVRKCTTEPQTKLFGINFEDFNLKFKSGLPLDNACYTFFINVFKEDANLLNLYKYSSLNNVFDSLSLQNFLNRIFELLKVRDDVNSSKWTLRMVSLLGDEELTQKVCDFVIFLFERNRTKEGKYLVNCLLASKKTEIIQTFKILQKAKNQNFLANLPDFLEKFADFNEVSIDILEDELAPEDFTYEEYEKEKKRLYESFINNRFYTREYFERYFIEHPLFNKLAQGLVFGEYKFQRLHNAFILQGKTKKFIVSSQLPDEDNVLISIIHPLDCDIKFQPTYNYFAIPTFNQFEDVLYDVKNFSRSMLAINLFSGVIVNPKDFIVELEKWDFVINCESSEVTYSSLVHVNKKLNLLAEVEFDKPVGLDTPFVSISSIYFYRLSDTIKSNGKYLTQKQNAIGVGSLPYRYFGFVLTKIITAIKNAQKQ